MSLVEEFGLNHLIDFMADGHSQLYEPGAVFFPGRGAKSRFNSGEGVFRPLNSSDAMKSRWTSNSSAVMESTAFWGVFWFEVQPKRIAAIIQKMIQR